MSWNDQMNLLLCLPGGIIIPPILSWPSKQIGDGGSVPLHLPKMSICLQTPNNAKAKRSIGLIMYSRVHTCNFSNPPVHAIVHSFKPMPSSPSSPHPCPILPPPPPRRYSLDKFRPLQKVYFLVEMEHEGHPRGLNTGQVTLERY